MDIRQNLDDLGGLYGLQFGGGDEFAPEFRDGDVLHFDTTELPKIGDIVAVWMRPEFVEPGKPQVFIYRLALGWQKGLTFPLDFRLGSEAIPVLILETGKGRQGHIRCDEVLGVHRKVAVVYATAAEDREILKAAE